LASLIGVASGNVMLESLTWAIRSSVAAPAEAASREASGADRALVGAVVVWVVMVVPL
jgi:hypothetical protein